ncbi:MAG: hypothetical protein ACYTHJ_12535 [Planctomycetota bacterium]|jgi:hypothetical protein
MPEFVCSCGTKYKLPDSAIGKKAKCKKCGNIFKVEAEETGPIPIAGDFDLTGEVDAALNRGEKRDQAQVTGAASPDFDPSKLPPPIIETSDGGVSHAGRGGGGSDVDYAGYFANLLDSLVFVKRGGDVIAFVSVAVIMILADLVLPWAPIIRPFATLIVVGWYCAFRFNVITGAAAGEADLPNLNPEGSWWDGILLPLIRWLGSYVLASVPAIFAMLLAFQAGWMTTDDIIALAEEEPGAMIRDAFVGGAALVGAMTIFGIFIWPMLILCIAIGGFSDVVRVDLIAITLIKTLPIYLLTTLLVFGAEFVQPLVALLGDGTPVRITGVAVEVYLEIVALRAIGLYYHHFKSRFGFAWG